MIRQSIKNLLSWVVIVALLVLLVWFPHAVAMPGQTTQISWLQLGLTYTPMFLSAILLMRLAKNQVPGRHSWMGVHTGVLALGFISMALLPQRCGFITASVSLLFVLTPYVLSDRASRRFEAGHVRRAASYARLLSLLHPTRHIRFHSFLLSAYALPSIEQKVAAYQALTSRAPPDESAGLNYWILVAQDDWMGVLTQLRSMGAKPMAGLEIRALGELGRVEEMAMTYAIAVAESTLAPNDFLCRLFVLAFTGRVEGVQSLLGRQLRSVRSERKAYWTFIACQAAGKDDEEARRGLQAAADATDDETFRRAARRHLDASLVAEGAS
jgi:hypothetical protein